MIDTIAILVTHVLLGITFWRLSARPDLDTDDLAADTQPGFAWPRSN